MFLDNLILGMYVRKYLEIQSLIIPGLIILFILIISFVIIIAHTWNLYNKLDLVYLLFNIKV